LVRTRALGSVLLSAVIIVTGKGFSSMWRDIFSGLLLLCAQSPACLCGSVHMDWSVW
jgi:hypothetical protein